MSVDKINFTGVTGTPTVSTSKVYGAAGKYLHNKELQSEILTLMPKPIKLLNKMTAFVGEVPTILINAIGTGLVAPIFIKYNFLSKTDEDTRTYSAMRQPLSAVLAVLIQAGVVIPIDRLVENSSNSGAFSNLLYNKSGCQDVDYLKRILKKSNPSLSKEGLQKLAEHKQTEQMQQIIDHIKEHNTFGFISNGKKIVLPEDAFRKVLKQTTADRLKYLEENIKRYNGEKFDHQVQRGEFLRTNHTTVSKVLDEIVAQAGTIKDEEKLREWLATKIKSLKKEEAHADLIQIVDDIRDRRNTDTIIEKAQDVQRKCGEFSNCASKKDVIDKIFDSLEAKKADLQAEKTVFEKIRKTIFSGDPIEKVIKEISELSNEEFLFDVVQKHIKNVTGNVKGLKQITGILVGLVTLPISATLLNVIYPKFMDVCFPNLSKGKQSKDKDQFVKNTQKQPPQSEKPVEKKSKEVQP